MELPAMFTHVPDASAPTRLSAQSNSIAIKYAADFSAAFFICLAMESKHLNADVRCTWLPPVQKLMAAIIE